VEVSKGIRNIWISYWFYWSDGFIYARINGKTSQALNMQEMKPYTIDRRHTTLKIYNFPKKATIYLLKFLGVKFL